ncbi:RNA-directed DNA polymerase, eukaryota [Artemisia annua]|uniref:RNA-directed DNA polymerase, eukaryota n=1 Tax=Artemisia annua TaxID=35608 RepID=A0A2U1P4Q4_ARTAN|nr:RNA-directed DNA polymerase, eukaryota [Artemisia annua]
MVQILTIWRFKKDRDSLWCRVIEAIHTTNRSWDFLPTHKALNGVWSNISKTISRTLVLGMPLRRCFKGNAGNGNGINFWIDPWVLNLPLKDVCPRLFRLEVNKRCKVSERLINSVSGLHYEWKWKKTGFSGEEHAEWQVLIALVGSVVLTDSTDKWTWVGSGNGSFSVGDVRKMLQTDLDFSQSSVFEWCKWIPKKCNIFGWRAEMGRIPTAAALSRRNIHIPDVSCPLCGDADETVDHLFSGCIVSSVLWHRISTWCKIQNLFAFSFKDLLEAHNYVGLTGKSKDIFYGIVIIGCWSIWKARNNLKFQQKKVKMDDIFSEVKVLGFLWAKNRAKLASLSWDNWCKFVIM